MLNKTSVLIFLSIGVIALIIYFITSCESYADDGNEVFFAKKNNQLSTVFSNDDAAQFEKDFGSRLATFNEANISSNAGAEWPYGGWTAEGRGVMVTSSVGRCGTDLMCDNNERLCSETKDGTYGCAHIAYERRTPSGLETDVQPVGYLLYGKKPVQSAVPAGYEVVAWNCSRGVWSKYDTAPSPSKLSEVYLVLPDGDDGQMEHASETMKLVVADFHRRGFDVRPAMYREVTEAQRRGAQWCIGGWTADLMLVNPMQEELEGCGGPGVAMNNFGTQGYLLYGPKPAASFPGYHIVPFYVGREHDKWSMY